MAEALPPDAQDVVRCIYCEKEVATEYCRKCGDELCTSCQKIHLKSKVPSGHEIVPIMQKYTEVPAYILCSNHITEKYDAACSDCVVPVCVRCVTEEHNKHSIVNLTDLYSETKANIVKKLDIMKTFSIPKTKHLIAKNNLHALDVKERFKDVVSQTNQNFAAFKDVISSLHSSVIENIKRYEKDSLADISTNSQNLEDYMTNLYNLIETFQSKEAVFHPADLILFCNEIEKHTKIPGVPEMNPLELKTVALDEQQIKQQLGELSLPSWTYITHEKDVISIDFNGGNLTDEIVSIDTNVLVVVAINIGTQYTYHGISFLHEYKDGNTFDNVYKNPTSILFKKDRTFHAFGKEAESIYNTLCDDDDKENWFLVQLWNTDMQDIDVNSNLKSVSGRDISALHVYSSILQYYKEKMEKTFERVSLSLHHIGWVFNIPAMQNTAAKGLLRRVLQEVGIPKDNYKVITRAEAAYMYSNHLSPDERNADWKPFKPSNRVILLNYNEYEFEITTFEVKDKDALDILSQRKGRKFAARDIFDRFAFMLTQVIGTDVYNMFCEENSEEENDLYENFKRKIKIFNEDSEIFRIKLPYSLRVLVESNHEQTWRELMAKSTFRSQLRKIGEYLQVDTEIVKEIIRKTGNTVVHYVNKEISKYGSNAIIFVGDFANIQMLEHIIRNSLPDHRLITSTYPSTAITKGSLILGHTIWHSRHRTPR